jgi:UDPglucose--hexose-1-phosphate uridylyltransferase
MILPIKHYSNLIDLSDKEKNDLSEAISLLTIKYDNLFNCSFSYSMGIHQSPCDNYFKNNNDFEKKLFHFHFHFYPPLLRSSSVKKFLVGYEMLAESQRDITAEFATKQLINCSNIHYKNIN